MECCKRAMPSRCPVCRSSWQKAAAHQIVSGYRGCGAAPPEKCATRVSKQCATCAVLTICKHGTERPHCSQPILPLAPRQCEQVASDTSVLGRDSSVQAGQSTLGC
jgi:hypothetical protein